MRKPRDYDSELQALTDKARALKERRIRQLGDLVIASKADALTVEQLAGALLAASTADAPTKEAWRVTGAAFFQRSARDAGRTRSADSRAAADNGGAAPV